ncbi:DUF5675 family protein [Ferrimonas sp.]|uniref:DUF5675 family protein n=1 Tax=Ferrimonas sp. TaxID=2080861 RepID=UPI003A92579B
MATYHLKRRHFDHGTFGTLHRSDGSQVCVMLERPWQNNLPNVSCIPAGRYRLKPHDSPKFGKVYALESASLGVGIFRGLRTHILIHAANLVEHLEGCIAPGLKFGVLRDQWAVIHSKQAETALFEELAGEEHWLEVA